MFGYSTWVVDVPINHQECDVILGTIQKFLINIIPDGRIGAL